MDAAMRRLQEEALLIDTELAGRREKDPLRRFVPNPGGQATFIASTLSGKLDENWFIAANRAGKSDAGAVVGATFSRFGNPNARFVGGAGSSIQVRDRATSGWVVSLDFPSSRDIIQPKYFDNGFLPPGASHEPFIPAWEIAEWRVSDQILKLRNGSIIGFKSADSGRVKFQGTEKDWVHFDEEPPEPIFTECTIRIGARRLNVFGTCTLLPPEGQVGGVTWVFEKKVRPWQSGTNRRIGIFNASIYENPYLSQEDIERLESTYPEGSMDRRIRLNGELIPYAGGGRVYSGFSYELNVRQQPIPMLRRPLCWIWDFNVEPMVSLLGQMIPVGGGVLFRVYKELVIGEGSLAEMVSLFRRTHPVHLAEIWIYGDASGKDRSHQTRKTSYQIILNEMKGYPAPCRLKVPEKNPPIVDRINAVNRICKDETGFPGLEMDPTCIDLIADMEQVITDGKGGIKKTFNKKDPYYYRTHTSDALGYWIHMERPVSTVSREQRSRVRIKQPQYGRR